MTIGHVIDILALVSALLASFLWGMASRQTLRRVSKTEVIDAADLNRIVVAINRSQVLNSRAALMTAFSALLVAARFALNVWPGVVN